MFAVCLVLIALFCWVVVCVFLFVDLIVCYFDWCFNLLVWFVLRVWLLLDSLV